MRQNQAYFEARYRDMSEEELARLNVNDLSEIARTCYERQIARRGIAVYNSDQIRPDRSIVGQLWLRSNWWRRSSDFLTGIIPSPAQSQSPPSKSASLQIGHYKVVAPIGMGGMGTVFKALDSQGQPVAIKIIGSQCLDQRAKAKESYRMGLVREARLAAELRHPNIVQIYDIGQERAIFTWSWSIWKASP